MRAPSLHVTIYPERLRVTARSITIEDVDDLRTAIDELETILKARHEGELK